MSLQRPVVILANGAFPSHAMPLQALTGAGTLICCDGAANQLLQYPRKPDVVVGDLDSISPAARTAFADRIRELPSQNRSDLEKALRWAAENGAVEVVVLGATGSRDDHSLGNLLLLHSDFGLSSSYLTDSGSFCAVRGERTLAAFPGQPVALFPDRPGVRFTTTGLAYPLKESALPALHRGVSNECIGDSFTLVVAGGSALVYQGYAPEPER